MSEKELKHLLIPKHTKLAEKEKQELLNKLNMTFKDLPKVFASDPAIAHLEAKEGDIIKITRKSPTAGEAVYYRGVMHG